jgi:hypothetical protein
LGRGVRHFDPLSPYLFILVLELLSAAIKNDPEIKGVKKLMGHIHILLLPV